MMIWINLAGLILIGLIVWWFWLYKAQSTQIKDGSIKVLVKDGVYQPANITVPEHQSVKLMFVREDATPCAETLLIPELDINETLALNKRVTVTIPASSAGVYPFHCQMQMYRGTLVIK
ncbi:cupredoxin domain-containing protein [Alteromonas macleodii]|uniref:cupredoxin domain-containing protein n=1 Tax=Alteromonas macleodii TaxID=28108 RepID=UPI0019309530|nr:cupredoxin domain-containing protein [Alteromonas macleodii]